MKDDLVRDSDGTIRFCDSNIVRLGYWWTVKHYTLDTLIDDIIEALTRLGIGLSALVFLLCSPITPPIRAYFRLKRAKEAVEYHKQHLEDSK